jgi:hypothetical protein
LALAAAGVVSLGSVVQAEEAQHQVLTALSSTTLSGYVDTSATWMLGTGNALPTRWNDAGGKQDGFNLNVVKLSLGKPMDEGQWSAGYQVDLLFGPDARLFPGMGGGANDMAIQQAYVNLRAPVGNGIDFKMGVFNGILGYESFDSYKNPNWSRSAGFMIQPLQHTGILASYQAAEWLSLQAGIANTWASQINGRGTKNARVVESYKTYMASLLLTAPESWGWLKGATLYGGVADGFGGMPKDTTSFHVGVTSPTPVEGLNLGLAYDYTIDVPCNATLNADNSMFAWAIAGYATYQTSEKWKFSNRFEYARGSSGWLYDSTRTEPANSFMADTFTVDYALWQNVVTRGEFRWDHELSGDKVLKNSDRNAYTFALNVIYKF